MRARSLGGRLGLTAKLHVSRPTLELASAPSQSGNGGSSPLGATQRLYQRPLTWTNGGRGHSRKDALNVLASWAATNDGFEQATSTDDSEQVESFEMPD